MGEKQVWKDFDLKLKRNSSKKSKKILGKADEAEERFRYHSKSIGELMPVTGQASQQHTSINQSVSNLCLVSDAVDLMQVTKSPQISDNLLCMVKKKH